MRAMSIANLCSFVICVLFGSIGAAPSTALDCEILCAKTDAAQEISGCACSNDIDNARARRRVEENGGYWDDLPISDDNDDLVELKRDSGGEGSRPYDSALKSVFRWGKRGAGVFRWGKRGGEGSKGYGNIFRWGKRTPSMSSYDQLTNYEFGDDLDSIDGPTYKRIFRWGKRSGDDSNVQLPPVFRWGKRNPSAVFRWGKRNKETGTPPVFRWGKRDEDDLITHIGTPFGWQGKRLEGSEGDKTPRGYGSVFRWGKRQAGSAAHNIFRWGKRSDDAADMLVQSLTSGNQAQES